MLEIMALLQTTKCHTQGENTCMYVKYRLEIVVVVISCSFNSKGVYLLMERKKKK